MSDSLKLAQDLKVEIEKEPLIIEYRRIKSLVDNDEDISRLKKEIALAKVNKEDALHKELLAKYHNHPLVSNLEVLKEEVNEYLLEISKIVNKK